MITMRFMLTVDPKLERLIERFVTAIEKGNDDMAINELLTRVRDMQQSDLSNQAEVKEKLDLILAVANEVTALRAKVAEQDELIAQLRDNAGDPDLVNQIVQGQEALSSGLQRIEDTLDPATPNPGPLPNPEPGTGEGGTGEGGSGSGNPQPVV